jgi:gamma-glutamylcyclotransferase (GGCT)/AIG2-like uncharacterized protein YtfP
MNKPEVYQLFVYGSLRSGFHSPAYEYISRYFDLLGEATVRGELYDLGTFPAAIPTDKNLFILGELYRIKNISEFSWAIGQLDDYEGVDVAFDEVQLYRRELTTAYCNQQAFPAWIYWYNGEVAGKPRIESGDVLDYIRQKK